MIDQIENTGSLRGDLLRLLSLYQKMFTEVSPEIMNAILYEMGQDNQKMAEMKAEATTKNIQTHAETAWLRQSQGGKIKEVSDATLTLPFDLIRVENLLRKDDIDKNRLELLVDEILLPVFRE